MANWSHEKKEALRVMVENGATRDELHAVFGPSWEAIQKAMRRQGLTYSPPPDFNIDKFKQLMEEKAWKQAAQE